MQDSGNDAVSFAATKPCFKTENRCSSFDSGKPLGHIFLQQPEVCDGVSPPRRTPPDCKSLHVPCL